jgi:hypothetical protein
MLAGLGSLSHSVILIVVVTGACPSLLFIVSPLSCAGAGIVCGHREEGVGTRRWSLRSSLSLPVELTSVTYPHRTCSLSSQKTCDFCTTVKQWAEVEE